MIITAQTYAFLDLGQVRHSAATALASLLRRGVGIQLDLVREVVVLIMLHLLCKCLARRLLECLLHVNGLFGTRFKRRNATLQTAPLMQLFRRHLSQHTCNQEH